MFLEIIARTGSIIVHVETFDVNLRQRRGGRNGGIVVKSTAGQVMMTRGIMIMLGYEQGGDTAREQATPGWGVRTCRERALLVSTARYRIWLRYVLGRERHERADDEQDQQRRPAAEECELVAEPAAEATLCHAVSQREATAEQEHNAPR